MPRQCIAGNGESDWPPLSQVCCLSDWTIMRDKHAHGKWGLRKRLGLRNHKSPNLQISALFGCMILRHTHCYHSTKLLDMFATVLKRPETWNYKIPGCRNLVGYYAQPWGGPALNYKDFSPLSATFAPSYGHSNSHVEQPYAPNSQFDLTSAEKIQCAMNTPLPDSTYIFLFYTLSLNNKFHHMLWWWKQKYENITPPNSMCPDLWRPCLLHIHIPHNQPTKTNMSMRKRESWRQEKGGGRAFWFHFCPLQNVFSL